MTCCIIWPSLSTVDSMYDMRDFTDPLVRLDVLLTLLAVDVTESLPDFGLSTFFVGCVSLWLLTVMRPPNVETESLSPVLSR